MKKKLVAFRLTPAARQLLKKLSAKLGVTQTGALELAIRALGRAEGLIDGREQIEEAGEK